MAPSGSRTTSTKRTKTRGKPARSHFKKQQHPQNKKQETPSSKKRDTDSHDDVAAPACSTPKGQKFRIPEISTCPPAPKKPRVLSNCSLRRSLPLAFFAPPDLEIFFCVALRDVPVSFITTMRKESEMMRNENENENESSIPTTRPHIMMETLTGERPRQHSPELSFAPRAHIARLAMRSLPPVKSFREDKTTCDESQRDCPICMEEFKDGELIQPFGVCAHQFHSSCINSWLLGGTTTCPLCRKELAH
ncbi:hypothetical protein RJT34_10703 [Clitoria ternatea]|uniref:RING-type domain-containing protein n=1 Tax=Clitoria ternatea TaxID=43366 RepID=A0AAN9JIJ9_CLITE